MDIAKIRRKLRESSKTEERVTPETTKDADSSLLTSQHDNSEGYKGAEERSKELILREIEKAEEVVELLVFSLFSEEYAFKVSELEEIIRPQQFTTIPRTPEYLLGVTSLRGKIIPIVDLKKMLSLTVKEDATRQKIIILKGDRGPIGVRVDRISGVVRLPAQALTESPPHLNESQLKYIDKVAIYNSRFISIINTEEIMNIM